MVTLKPGLYSEGLETTLKLHLGARSISPKVPYTSGRAEPGLHPPGGATRSPASPTNPPTLPIHQQAQTRWPVVANGTAVLGLGNIGPSPASR